MHRNTTVQDSGLFGFIFSAVADASSYYGWKETPPHVMLKEKTTKTHFAVWDSCPSTRQGLDEQQLMLDSIKYVWKK
jgi:hypothetical protein